uniref:HIG1 domain-containing protein n=1 Tax=Zonotrichia albicollis TaxID=44394 RepID=A0A8D2MWV2_ZONAL
PANTQAPHVASSPVPCFLPETSSEKNKLTEHQSCLCTVSVLVYGIICFKKGNTRRSQLMMRARVIAQGCTFAALLGGMAATAFKSRQ